VLQGYVLSQAIDIASAIVNLAVEANNFELRSTLMSFMEKDQFDGCPTKNPLIHLSNFLAMCDIIKLNRVSVDVIRLRLFPFSLTDRASEWFLNEEPNSFTTWEALSRAFLSKYFLLGKAAKLRVKITSFSQRGDESLFEVRERFKDLQC